MYCENQFNILVFKRFVKFIIYICRVDYCIFFKEFYLFRGYLRFVSFC